MENHSDQKLQVANEYPSPAIRIVYRVSEQYYRSLQPESPAIRTSSTVAIDESLISVSSLDVIRDIDLEATVSNSRERNSFQSPLIGLERG
jgi:hypothetical protein